MIDALPYSVRRFLHWYWLESIVEAHSEVRLNEFRLSMYERISANFS